jgi:hypothetical protein
VPGGDLVAGVVLGGVGVVPELLNRFGAEGWELLGIQGSSASLAARPCGAQDREDVVRRVTGCR